jgi:hypothetical protein
MIDTVVPSEPKTKRWVKVLLAVICLLIAAMWVYAFVFAPKSGVYFVTDKAWRQSADQLCANAEQQRLALVDTTQGYITNPTHEQMTQRADIVDRATAIVGKMVDDVQALPLDGAENRTRVDIFVKYYRQIVADRLAYTARLRSFQLEPYRETLVNKEPVSNIVIAFTTANVPKCLPPGELGGDV